MVHSRWVLGALSDLAVSLGLHYKTKQAFGTVATVSIVDVSGSASEQDVVKHTLTTLRELLSRDIATMQVGQLAPSEIMLRHEVRRNSNRRTVSICGVRASFLRFSAEGLMLLAS